MFVYFERERERARTHEWGRSKERGRERIPRRLRAVSAELDAREPRDHDLSRNQELDASWTGPPRCL